MMAPPVAAQAMDPSLRLSLFIDEGGALTLPAVRQLAEDGRFRAMTGGKPANLGLTSDSIWVLAEIDGLTKRGVAWYLELAYANLDQVDAFVVVSGTQHAAYRLGEDALAERPVAHRYPLLPLPDGVDSMRVFLRIQSQGSVLLPLKLLSASELQARNRLSDLFYAGYFVSLATMLIYNGFIWLAVRHRSYLYYVAYLAVFGAMQFHMNGYSFQLLPPFIGFLANPLLLLLLSIVEALGMLFVMSFLDTRRILPRLHSIAVVVTILCLTTGLAGLVLPYAYVLRALLALAVVVLILLATIVARALYDRRRMARFLALAFGALAPGCAVQVLLNLGALSETFLTGHLLEVSTVLEMLLLSFALADRINVVQAEQRRAERALQRSAREHAERMVQSLEAERRRVAGELHDSIGQNLLVIGNQLGRLRARTDAQALRRPLGEVAELAHDTVQEIRAIAHRLYPQQIARLGLRDALEATLTQAFEGSRTALHLSLPDRLPSMPAETAAHLFHIAQEAASNVLRHAEADNCWIELGHDEGQLRLRIADDGKGIEADRAEATDTGGLGLVGQRERAMILGGELAIAKRPGGGTLLILSLPLEESP